MELMQAVEHYATAMKLAERYGNDHGDVDAANNAWRECKKAADELQEYARDVLRLVETVKYLRGIAARGEGREMRDDETVEGFVLGYVKKLETTIERKYGTEECEGCADRDEEIDRLKDALRMAADEPNIDKARAIADAVLTPNINSTAPHVQCNIRACNVTF